MWPFRKTKKKRVNKFTIVDLDGDTFGGSLTRGGDLIIYINGHEMSRIPGRAIPMLAHWLTEIKGAYSYVNPDILVPTAPVLSISDPKRGPEGTAPDPGKDV